MNAVITTLLAAGAGLGLGFAGARHFSAPATAGESPPTASEVSRPDRHGSPGVADPAGGRELPNLIRLARNHKEHGDPTVLREIERLGTADLEKLIVDFLETGPKNASPEAKPFHEVLKMAVREWFRREGEDAFHEAEAQENPETRRLLLYRVLEAAAENDPRLAKKWADRMSLEVGEGPDRIAAHTAIWSAFGRSADAYLEAARLFPNWGSTVSASTGSTFADNFDFRKALEGSGSPTLVAAWAAREPEPAWRATKGWIDEKGKPAASYVGQVFSGIAMVEGEEAAVGWLGDKITEIPKELRADALRSVRNTGGLLRSERAAAMLAKMEATHDPAGSQ